MEEAKITSKGQITIPKKVRKTLGLKSGKRIVFLIEEGRAIMMPKTEDPIKKLKELRNKIHFTQKEIEEMIKESKKTWD